MYRDKSRPGIGRSGREAIPAAVEAMKPSEPGRKVAACGRLASEAFMNSLCDPQRAGLEFVAEWYRSFRLAYGCTE